MRETELRMYVGWFRMAHGHLPTSWRELADYMAAGKKANDRARAAVRRLSGESDAPDIRAIGAEDEAWAEARMEALVPYWRARLKFECVLRELPFKALGLTPEELEQHIAELDWSCVRDSDAQRARRRV